MSDRSEQTSRRSVGEHDPNEPLLEVEQKLAMTHALEYAFQHDAYMGQKPVGDYLVAYIVEYAKWMRYSEDGTPVCTDPGQENAHIAIAVHDHEDLHFIPGLKVFMSVYDDQGNRIGTHQLSYLRRPQLHHYGRNWKLPGDGIYRLHVHIDPPDLMQYSQTRGLHYLEPVDVDFNHVEIKTGRRIS